jgi:hypothetical protein
LVVPIVSVPLGQARPALGILRGAGVDHREERKDRRFGPLANEDGQSVRQLLDRDAFLKRRHILGGGESGKDDKE